MNDDVSSRPKFRWFGVAGDKRVGHDFEAGLAKLKTRAEAR